MFYHSNKIHTVLCMCAVRLFSFGLENSVLSFRAMTMVMVMMIIIMMGKCVLKTVYLLDADGAADTQFASIMWLLNVNIVPANQLWRATHHFHNFIFVVVCVCVCFLFASAV